MPAAAAACASVIFPDFICRKIILETCSLDIPNDFAIASCWILFPELKAPIIAWFSPISLVKPAISLFKAAWRAPSRLISFPVSNSASNSFAIEFSKLSKLSAIPSASAKLIPNDAAPAAASVRASVLLPKLKAKAPDALPTSSITAPTFRATLFCWINCLVVAYTASDVPFKVPPNDSALKAKFAAAFSLTPSKLVNSAAAVIVSPLKAAFTLIPISLDKEPIVLAASIDDTIEVFKKFILVADCPVRFLTSAFALLNSKVLFTIAPKTTAGSFSDSPKLPAIDDTPANATASFPPSLSPLAISSATLVIAFDASSNPNELAKGPNVSDRVLVNPPAIPNKSLDFLRILPSSSNFSSNSFSIENPSLWAEINANSSSLILPEASRDCNFTLYWASVSFNPFLSTCLMPFFIRRVSAFALISPRLILACSFNLSIWSSLSLEIPSSWLWNFWATLVSVE